MTANLTCNYQEKLSSPKTLKRCRQGQKETQQTGRRTQTPGHKPIRVDANSSETAPRAFLGRRAERLKAAPPELIHVRFHSVCKHGFEGGQTQGQHPDSSSFLPQYVLFCALKAPGSATRPRSTCLPNARDRRRLELSGRGARKPREAAERAGLGADCPPAPDSDSPGLPLQRSPIAEHPSRPGPRRPPSHDGLRRRSAGPESAAAGRVGLPGRGQPHRQLGAAPPRPAGPGWHRPGPPGAGGAWRLGGCGGAASAAGGALGMPCLPPPEIGRAHV